MLVRVTRHKDDRTALPIWVARDTRLRTDRCDVGDVEGNECEAFSSGHGAVPGEPFADQLPVTNAPVSTATAARTRVGRRNVDRCFLPQKKRSADMPAGLSLRCTESVTTHEHELTEPVDLCTPGRRTPEPERARLVASAAAPREPRRRRCGTEQALGLLGGARGRPRRVVACTPTSTCSASPTCIGPISRPARRAGARS